MNVLLLPNACHEQRPKVEDEDDEYENDFRIVNAERQTLDLLKPNLRAIDLGSALDKELL
jgi:hypothetical protein